MNDAIEHFSAIIVGADQAGPALAGRLTAAGRTVAIIERHHFGGTCVNTGCTPTKAMIASARVAHMARRAGEFGVGVRGKVKVDLAAVKSRKDAILMKSRNGVRGWLLGMDGCTVIEDHARFVGPKRIQTGDRVLEADNIFINVGGRAVVPTWEGCRFDSGRKRCCEQECGERRHSDASEQSQREPDLHGALACGPISRPIRPCSCEHAGEDDKCERQKRDDVGHSHDFDRRSNAEKWQHSAEDGVKRLAEAASRWSAAVNKRDHRRAQAQSAGQPAAATTMLRLE